MNVLVTGAGGFLGKALVKHLAEAGTHKVLSLVRSTPDNIRLAENFVVVPDIAHEVNWSTILTGVDVIVHAAARAHVLNDASVNPMDEFRRTNVDATVNIARHAIAAGVRRFVFISSIGVCGASSSIPFSEKTSEKPEAFYAISKQEAEHALKALFKNSGVELVIIRPPLVYAWNAPGNFRLLLKLVQKGVPFPLGLLKNRRSFIALENLVDFIRVCIDNPKAADELFVISDGESTSTKELIQWLAQGMAKRAIMLPVPIFILRFSAVLLKRQSTFQQLCGSLEVDNLKARKLLRWVPVIKMKEALIQAGQLFIGH